MGRGEREAKVGRCDPSMGFCGSVFTIVPIFLSLFLFGDCGCFKKLEWKSLANGAMEYNGDQRDREDLTLPAIATRPTRHPETRLSSTRRHAGQRLSLIVTVTRFLPPSIHDIQKLHCPSDTVQYTCPSHARVKSSLICGPSHPPLPAASIPINDSFPPAPLHQPPNSSRATSSSSSLTWCAHPPLRAPSMHNSKSSPPS